MAGKNRTFRTDILTHPKTAGLYPLDRDILLTQVVAANIAGVLQRSVAQVSRSCGGGTTQRQVKASLRRLEKAGVVRYWSELEIIWAVEAADNQGRTPNAWKGVVNAVDVLPKPVRDAFWERYKGRPGAPEDEGPSEGPGEGGARTGSSIKDEEFKEKKGATRSPAPRAQVTPPKTKASVESERRFAIARFREAVLYDPECRPNLPGHGQLGVLSVSESTLGQRLAEGATPEELHQVAKNLARRITSGELPAELWGGLGFSWPYGALRDGLPVSGKSKPGLALVSGPRIADKAEAEAWARDHGGKLPGGWQWEQDGRGGVDAVRTRGAS